MLSNRHRSPWSGALLCILVFAGARALLRLAAPFTDVVDFNAAVWSQAAHNFLRAGLGAGVPAAFYFGPLPIPQDAWYVHHPPLLALVLTAGFRIFGEYEWVARLIPAVASLACVAFLWLVVKDCRGPRAAAFATALFAAMPMELHYGLMVNFEPCTLAALLAGLLGQRRWECAEPGRGGGWFGVMVAGYFVALSTAWLGYFFVIPLAVVLIVRGHRRAGWLLIGLALLSAALFLLQIRLASPGAWSNAAFAFRIRLGHSTISGVQIPFTVWALRIWRTLVTHILWPSWLLAAGGLFVLIRGRSDSALRWLGRVCLIFFALSAFYVGAFRNASYIHNYSAFYFVLPVAICGGIALDAAATWLDLRFQNAGSIAALLLCGLLCIWGWRAADGLLGQARILETQSAEPADLIPRLGQLIRAEFAPDATVMINFDYSYIPQLSYYAQHRILNGLTSDSYWKDALQSTQPVGGLVWAGEPGAAEILALLKRRGLRAVEVEGLSFYVWTPQQK
jgi:hypothetical protein